MCGVGVRAPINFFSDFLYSEGVISKMSYERTSIQEKYIRKLNLKSQSEPELWPFKDITV